LVITREWIAEAMAMWFIAAVVIVATPPCVSHQNLTDWVDRVSGIMLLAIATLTAVTGAGTSIVFKICPVLLIVTAGLFLAGSWG